MLFAVAGSQGSGKSTTLNALKEKGYNIIERKTSRSILDDWNVTLQEVNNDPALTIRFQDEITKRKRIDELSAIHSDDIWFTERTHSDLFTYAVISLGKDNQYSAWLDEYYEKCDLYNEAYMKAFYLTAGHFNIEHDGVRGSNQHYSRMVDAAMLDFTKQMMHNDSGYSLEVVNNSDLDMRVNQILWGAIQKHKSWMDGI